MIRRLLARLRDRLAPLGYEDPDGFHYGEPPYIAAQVRAALNGCEGYPLDLGDIPHIPSGAHLPRTGPGAASTPHARGAGNSPEFAPSHASGDTA